MIKTYQKLKIQNHDICLHISGNTLGQPLFLIHGGPGSGSSVRALEQINLEKFMVVQIDQRGSGQSLPSGCIQNNTTPLLLEDIEIVRQYLSIDQLMILGGSWGASLALLYASRYVQRTKRIFLRNIFLCSQDEITQFFKGNQYAHLPLQISNGTFEERVEACKSWYQLENPSFHSHLTEQEITSLLPKYQIQAHFIQNHFFIEENTWAQSCMELNEIPIDLIHGELDSICPLANSKYIHTLLPHANLRIIPDCGHDPFHPNMAATLTHLLDLI